MKLLKLNNEELSNAITSGDTYIQIGSRKFMLFEIDEVSQSGNYEVTDPEEEMLLLDAMNADNPSLSKQEVLEQLARRNRK
ncbi:hypothetical protein [Cohnella cellulosilytica]|uniref:Uncharacterized protein n=1 Tax=Cohnella cellulosilytica TaxID=986710 RepID=A0ABW2F3S3_9BACL